MKKIACITGTRGEYGAISSVLREISKSHDFDLVVIATGMHLMPKFGNTINEIKKDGYEIHKIDAVYKKDTLGSTLKFISRFLDGLTDELVKLKPDLILLIGDRAEMLAGAIAGQYLNIPVAHLSGGDLTGHVDDSVRHAITKLSDFHFPTNERSKETIIKMGEAEERVHLVGATSIDNIKNKEIPEKEKIAKKYDLNVSKPYIIALQHPVINEIDDVEKHTKNMMDAIVDLKIQSVVIYPNADAGGRKIIDITNQYKNYPFIKIAKNVEYKGYFGLLKYASAIVGNSSSAIIESPSFGIPAINIGTRQIGRLRAENVIDIGYEKEEIIKAIKKSLDDETFKSRCRQCKSPYGDGTAGKKIVKILSELKSKNKIMKKKTSFEK